MAKVKHMAVGAPKRGQDGGRASARRLGASQQGHGVEVSLQSNAITDPVAARADIQRPIDADRVTTARREKRFKKCMFFIFFSFMARQAHIPAACPPHPN